MSAGRAAYPRRQFLKGVLLAPIFCRRASARAAPFGDGSARQAEIRTLLSMFADIEVGARVGRRCVEALPAAERSVARLGQILLGDLPVAGDIEQTRSLVGQRIRLDFADGDTIGVDGWVLSATEARLCALAALAGPADPDLYGPSGGGYPRIRIE